MTQAFGSMAEFKNWQDATANYAKLAMRRCPNPMIDDAVNNGWTRSCQDILRDAIRRHSMEHGELPSMDYLARVRVPNTKADPQLDYYRRNGQSLIDADVADIKSARASLPRRTSRKDQAAGEVA